MHHRLAHKTIWWRHFFFQLGISPVDDSSLCPVDMKLASTLIVSFPPLFSDSVTRVLWKNESQSLIQSFSVAPHILQSKAQGHFNPCDTALTSAPSTYQSFIIASLSSPTLNLRSLIWLTHYQGNLPLHIQVAKRLTSLKTSQMLPSQGLLPRST